MLGYKALRKPEGGILLWPWKSVLKLCLTSHIKTLLIFILPYDGGLHFLWLSSYRQTDRQTAAGWITGANENTSYRAEILVLHLLELSISIAGAQLHVSQNHLEDGVVDGLGEVHVELIHSSLQRSPKGPLWRRNLEPTAFLDRKLVCHVSDCVFHLKAWWKKWAFLFCICDSHLGNHLSLLCNVWLMKKEEQERISSDTSNSPVAPQPGEIVPVSRTKRQLQ